MKIQFWLDPTFCEGRVVARLKIAPLRTSESGEIFPAVNVVWICVTRRFHRRASHCDLGLNRARPRPGRRLTPPTRINLPSFRQMWHSNHQKMNLKDGPTDSLRPSAEWPERSWNVLDARARVIGAGVRGPCDAAFAN